MKPLSEKFERLTAFLQRVPGIGLSGTGEFDDGRWWVKFNIDITHSLAWHVVQEFGHVLNYVSLDDRLPTVFMPVSPPPCLNGGPADFLSWVIESTGVGFAPDAACEWLEGRLPNPVDDISAWETDADAGEDQEPA